MKCEHCGGDMVWEGSLVSGRMSCNYCELMKAEHEYVPTPTADIIYEVFGAGGGGGCASQGAVVVGPSGGASSVDQVAQQAAQQAAKAYLGGRGSDLAKAKICTTCNGSGLVHVGNGNHTYCHDCSGIGVVSC